MVYMKILKRNQIVVAVIALMLVTAGYLNFANQNKESNLIPTSSAADSELMAGIGDAQLVSANETKENNQTQNETVENTENVATTNKTKEDTASNITQNTSAQEDSYFAQSKLDRDKMYSQMLDNYQKILETNNLSSEEKKTAQEEIKRINNEKNAIMIAENLIKTKGFQDIVIFVNNGNVTGVVQKDKLDEKDIAQIQNIITRELNVKTNKINISGKNVNANVILENSNGEQVQCWFATKTSKMYYYKTFGSCIFGNDRGNPVGISPLDGAYQGSAVQPIVFLKNNIDYDYNEDTNTYTINGYK